MSNKEEQKRIAKIRDLNDHLRQTFSGGTVLLTKGIRSKPPLELCEILEKVKNFNNFSKDLDSFGEHDYLSFDYKGDKIIAKIDYYSPDMKYGSEDPSDPSKCARTLTIMLDSDW